jgi:uncharacterized protein YndB with AHSA1/START domain
VSEEITISRVFDASPELVYRAFADPDQFCLWFGPDGFSVPFETVQIDARSAGYLRYTLTSDADPSVRSRVDVTFTEVIENELLEGHQEVEGAPATRMRLRLEFRDEGGGKTRLHLRQGPFKQEGAEAAKTGWEDSFVGLDSLLRRSQ